MAKTPEKLTEELEELKEQVDRLSKLVVTPDSGIADRLTAIETDAADAFIGDNSLGDVAAPPEHPPDTKVDFVKERPSFGGDVLPFDIEFGKPTANVTSDAATVTMQPCDKDGNSFASAAEVTVYVANDRQVQDLDARGWTTSTILSFIRFSPFVDDTPDIEGVLIGEPLLDKYEDAAAQINDIFRLDKLYTFNGDVGWTTIDTRDWRGRWIWITMVDSDTDIDEYADDDVEHWDSIAAAYAFQTTQPHAWFQVLLFTDFQSEGGSAPQPISRDIFSPGVLDSGDFFLRMKTDGNLEIMVENWAKQFSVRFSILSTAEPPTVESLG